MTEIQFFVPGVPRPGGSKKPVGRTREGRIILVDACKHVKEWRESVKFAAMAAHTGALLDCAMELTITFYQTRPNHHYGTGKNAGVLKASAPKYPLSAPDTTKLTRSTEDALKNIVWTDDSRVVDQHCFKRYGDKPGALIIIRTLG